MKTDKELQEAADKYIFPFKHQIPLGQDESVKNDFIAGAKWMREKDNWIKVEDGLPENDSEVLLFVVNEIVQGYLKDGFWKGSVNVTSNMNDGYVNDRVICRQGSNFDFVTHWQPLPNHPIKK